MNNKEPNSQKRRKDKISAFTKKKDGQQEYEEMLITTDNQGNASQSENQILLHTSENSLYNFLKIQK